MLLVFPHLTRAGDVQNIFVRIFLCGWFCLLYLRLNKINSYSHYPNIRWKKEDVGKGEKHLYIFFGALLGLGSTIITYWSIKANLLVPDFLNLALSTINGLIIAIPIVRNYWVLKL